MRIIARYLVPKWMFRVSPWPLRRIGPIREQLSPPAIAAVRGNSWRMNIWCDEGAESFTCPKFEVTRIFNKTRT
jgi:hypothetical protein